MRHKTVSNILHGILAAPAFLAVAFAVVQRFL